jgi:hypothetical protein
MITPETMFDPLLLARASKKNGERLFPIGKTNLKRLKMVFHITLRLAILLTT